MATLRARPLRSRILARACSRVIVGVRAGLLLSKLVPLPTLLPAPEGVRARSLK